MSTSEKREGVIEWEDFFMATACVAARRSKDPNCQVGACIVNKENIIVGIGYNGMPKGCHDDEFPWGKDSQTHNGNKFYYVCHAEMNAIMNKNSANLKKGKIYVNLFPCNECAKMIIQSGIKEVVYLSDKGAQKDEYKASKRMLNIAGVKHRQLKTKLKIEIDFEKIVADMNGDQHNGDRNGGV